MTDCNNNNIVSVERDICTGIGNNTIHQLNKLDEKLGKRKRVRIYPITYIQAVYDAKTGTRLDGFLNMVNSIYLPWRGSAKSTRLQVPFHLRRKGLMISYRNIDNEIITEKCILEECIKDDLFKLDSSWVRITDALPVSGNVTIGSNGNWFVDGEDTGFKAQGPKGDNGVPLQPRLSEDGTKIEYSLDGEEWKELFPLSLITPNISFEEPVGLEPGATPTVENVGDGFNVNLQFGLPKAPEVNVGSTTTIGEGNQAKVTNSGTPYAPVLNFQIPKGDTGCGITIKGFYPDLSALQEKITSPAIGDVYCVGTAEPYTGYVWTNVYSSESQTAAPAWQSIGTINKDTTILVNELGDREDVGMTQKGLLNLAQLIDTSYSSIPIILKGVCVNVSEGATTVNWIDSDIYHSAIVKIYSLNRQVKRLYVEGLKGENNFIAYFSSYEVSTGSYIGSMYTTASSSVFIVPDDAILAVLDIRQDNMSQEDLDKLRITQIGGGSSKEEVGSEVNSLTNFFSIPKSAINIDGNLYNSVDGLFATEFLPINRNEDIVVVGGWLLADHIAPIAFYDDAKKFISAYTDEENYDSNIGIVKINREDIPKDAKYIRCTANTIRFTPCTIYGLNLADLYLTKTDNVIFKDTAIKNGSFSGYAYIDYNHSASFSGSVFERYGESFNWDAAWIYLSDGTSSVEVTGLDNSINRVLVWFSDKTPSQDTFLGSGTGVPEGAKLLILDIDITNGRGDYSNLKVKQNGFYSPVLRENVAEIYNNVGLINYQDSTEVENIGTEDGYIQSTGNILITSNFVHTSFPIEQNQLYHIINPYFSWGSRINTLRGYDKEGNLIWSGGVIDSPGGEVDEYITFPSDVVELKINWISTVGEGPSLYKASRSLINVREELDNIESGSGGGSSSKNKLMKVHIYGLTTGIDARLFYVRSKYNEEKDIVVLHMTNDNTLIRPDSAYIGSNILSDDELMTSEYLVSSHSDSTAPFFYISPYWHLFAQHGYPIPYIDNTVNMTSSDVGALWRDQLNREYNIGNVTENHIYLLPVIYQDSYGHDKRDWESTAQSTAITTLTHVSGGTVTQNITVEGLAQIQLEPIMKSFDRKWVIDGKIINEEGDYYCDDFSVSESQIGYDPASIETWFPSPDLENAGELARFTWSYNFKGANCCVNTTVDIRKELTCHSYGATQQQFFFDKGDYKAMFLIPKAAARNGIELDKPFNSPSSSSSGYSFYRTSKYLKDIDKPIDRMIGYLENPDNNTYLVGMAAGLSLVSGDTTTEKRIANMPEGGDNNGYYRLGSISPSNVNKFYIAAINTAQYEDNDYYLPTTYFKEINYYISYFDPAQNEGQVYWYKDGSSYVIYAHCQSFQEKLAINLPEIMEGLKVEIVEKTDGTTLLTDSICNSKIYVNYTNEANYIVLKTI